MIRKEPLSQLKLLIRVKLKIISCHFILIHYKPVNSMRLKKTVKKYLWCDLFINSMWRDCQCHLSTNFTSSARSSLAKSCPQPSHFLEDIRLGHTALVPKWWNFVTGRFPPHSLKSKPHLNGIMSTMVPMSIKKLFNLQLSVNIRE